MDQSISLNTLILYKIFSEKAILFSCFSVDFNCSLYTITGENRENRGRMGKRVLLRRQTATIYAGELNDAAAYYGMDEDLLRRSFSLIVGTWSN